MLFVMSMIAGLAAGALAAIAWNSVCLIGGWPMLEQDVVVGIIGLGFVGGAAGGVALTVSLS